MFPKPHRPPIRVRRRRVFLSFWTFSDRSQANTQSSVRVMVQNRMQEAHPDRHHHTCMQKLWITQFCHEMGLSLVTSAPVLEKHLCMYQTAFGLLTVTLALVFKSCCFERNFYNLNMYLILSTYLHIFLNMDELWIWALYSISL